MHVTVVNLCVNIIMCIYHGGLTIFMKEQLIKFSIFQAEVTQRLSNAKEAASKPAFHSHEDLARKLQVKNI